MKFGIRVMPRNEVLDSQGRAVERTLSHQGRRVNSCRVGKYVVLDIEGTDRAQAEREAQEIAKSVLHNPLIETFELEVLS